MGDCPHASALLDNFIRIPPVPVFSGMSTPVPAHAVHENFIHHTIFQAKKQREPRLANIDPNRAKPLQIVALLVVDMFTTMGNSSIFFVFFRIETF